MIYYNIVDIVNVYAVKSGGLRVTKMAVVVVVVVVVAAAETAVAVVSQSALFLSYSIDNKLKSNYITLELSAQYSEL